MDFNRGSRAEIDGEEENTRLENRQEAEENRRSYAAESVQHRALTRFPFLKIVGAPTDAGKASVVLRASCRCRPGRLRRLPDVGFLQATAVGNRCWE
jgi:hypothetical protein